MQRLGGRFDLHLCAATKTYEEDLEHIGVIEVCTRVDLYPKPDLQSQPEAYAGCSSLLIAENACPQLTQDVQRHMAAGSVDVVHAEGFYMAQHARGRGSIPLLLVEQNLEYALCGNVST